MSLKMKQGLGVVEKEMNGRGENEEKEERRQNK